MRSTDTIAPTPAPRSAVVFIDVEAYFRGTRECFGATSPDVNPVALADALCAHIGFIAADAIYTYFSAPQLLGAARYSQVQSIRAAGDQRSHLYVSEDRPYARLTAGIDGVVGEGVRVYDKADILLQLAVDAADEATVEDVETMIFVTREPAISGLVAKLREINRRDGVSARYYCAAPASEASAPILLPDLDWVYIDVDMYKSCRLQVRV